MFISLVVACQNISCFSITIAELRVFDLRGQQDSYLGNLRTNVQLPHLPFAMSCSIEALKAYSSAAKTEAATGRLPFSTWESRTTAKATRLQSPSHLYILYMDTAMFLLMLQNAPPPVRWRASSSLQMDTVEQLGASKGVSLRRWSSKYEGFGIEYPLLIERIRT